MALFALFSLMGASPSASKKTQEVIRTDDPKIIELFFSRSEDAIRQLDIKYGKLLRRIIGGIVDSAEDTDELIDDTYMKLWFSIPPERP